MELENIALDPSVVIDDVLNLFWDKASSNGLDLAGYVAPEIPKTIMGDPVRLNQVISNLVNNALKFTEHGHVIVKVEMIGDAGNPLVRFAVTDTGIGIPQDKLSAVFESFSQADQTTTRRFGGTGLGLAICKRLVTAMGGEISVTSTEGVGSEFSFTVAQAATEASPEVASSFEPGRLEHAIVATNSSATSTIISDYLGDFGIKAITVSPSSLNETEVKGKDLVLASPNALDQLTINGAPAPEKPYLISVSQLGDLQSDGLIGERRAHDVLMRPVSRNGILELVARLKNGAPRGLALLERHESKKPPAFPNANVLVADDSPVNREVVIEALKQMEVTADVVEDGVAAVSAAADKNYHLILMDCSMPEMDGFEATCCIPEAEKDMGHRVPIVALSANVAGAKANEWQDAGMDAYLSKPFRIIDLVETFEEFLPEDIRPQKEEILSKADGGANESEASEAPIVDEPIIDENVLCEAMGCEVGDRGEIVMRVLELFEDHGPPALLKVAESASDKGNSEIADTAHALKSMARNIGAIRLGSACEILEREAKGGHIEHLPAKLSHLQIELVAVLDWIKACQDKQPDQPDSMCLMHEVLLIKALCL
jgi:CheY-like chemotaxis protein/HPt (histidine-containing phosphotransfer) domain-containing protein